MKTNCIRRNALGVLGVAATLSLTALGHTQVLNGSFETGDYTDWSTLGDDLIATSAIGSGPTNGTYEALLATATDGTAGYKAGTGTNSASTMESFLGASSGSIAGVGNGNLVLGSAIKQSFTLVAGEKLTFDWDFLTNQTYNDGTADSVKPLASNDDFAFFSLGRTGGSTSVTKLADVFDGYKVDSSNGGGFDTAFTITPASDPFIAETGFSTFSFTATVSGTYTLGIGVVHAVNGVDDGVNSGLLVDNVQAVPEPVSMIGLGALCLGLARRRKR